ALKASQYGYLIDAARWDTSPALVQLFSQGCCIRAATKPFRMNNRDYGTGTLLLRNHENREGLHVLLTALQTSLGVTIEPVNTARVQDGYDLGSGRFALLNEPRTAICTRWPLSTTSFGSLWYLLDHQAGLQCSPVSIQSLAHLDLRTYNVLLLPESHGLNRILDEPLLNKLKRWVEAGGTLIAVGDSAAHLAHEDRNLSAVRLKRDVLDRLDVYAEAVQKERHARTIQVDSSSVWEGQRPSDANHPEDKNSKPDLEQAQRHDEWLRIFRPSGVFLAGQLDTEHWLAAGLDEHQPVYFQGGNAFMSSYPVATVARLAPAANLRLSGLLWPEARERIADSAYTTVERVGRGQVILFATDPSFRMWFPSLQRLLLNAVLLGPGMGTSPPRPW
ncbi:hypothetical protein ACFL6U_33190, partial [Planctomycetota bacterium]